VPGQRRLAISRLRVPNLDGFVTTAAGNLLSIGTPRHRPDTVFVRSQYTNQQKPGGKTWGKNLLARVPGQRRLAISRLRVPNLDGFVVAAAGNLFSIGTPRHKVVDPEIVRSQDTNQQKQREEKFGEKELEKRKTYELECPISVDSTNPVRASQTTTRHPSTRASLDPSGEKATASISTPPRIVNLHARRHCRGLTRSMKA